MPAGKPTSTAARPEARASASHHKGIASLGWEERGKNRERGGGEDAREPA